MLVAVVAGATVVVGAVVVVVVVGVVVGVVVEVEVVGVVVVVEVDVFVLVVVVDEFVESTAPEAVLEVPTVKLITLGTNTLEIVFGATLFSTFLITAFFTATLAGVLIVDLVATFTVLFGASRLISAADAVEGVTSAIAAIAAASVTFFIIPFSSQEVFVAIW